MVAVIRAEGLGHRRNGADILQDVSFGLPPGELVMLVGPNGAGKSTLLHILAGQTPMSAGRLLLQEQDCAQFSRADWARAVTLVPQLSSMGFPLSAAEVVELGGLAHSTSLTALRRQVRAALADWEITYLASRDVRLLSGGEQQRCQLARSWIQVQQPDSRLWLLDEPLSALDLRHQQQCMQRAQQLTASGKTVVMVVHDLNLARRFADRVLMLSCGRLVAAGTAAAVLTAEQVSQTFMLDVRLEGNVLSWD